MGADFVAISGHKMCGPTGIGCLLATSECIEEMEPFMSGGDMIETVTMEKSTFASGPQKFEAGTPKIAEAIGFAAAGKKIQAEGIYCNPKFSFGIGGCWKRHHCADED